ncbi:MAG TPA: hypothetical protein VNF07_12335 [Acidimicrobiales bacterium]|nr:hypothetical protein [Acidimicrobiales bacterium]
MSTLPETADGPFPGGAPTHHVMLGSFDSTGFEQLRFAALSLATSPAAHETSADTISLPVTRLGLDTAPVRIAAPLPPALPQRPPRRPAPSAVRGAVLSLLAIVVFSNLGLAVLKLQPKLLAAVKADLHPTASVASAATVERPAAAHFGLVSSGAASATYAVPSAHYTISLSIDRPCWVVVRSPIDAAKPLLASVLVPATATPIPVTGSASIVIAARAQSITISNGAKVLGVIPSPVLDTTYTFSPNVR